MTVILQTVEVITVTILSLPPVSLPPWPMNRLFNNYSIEETDLALRPKETKATEPGLGR